MPDQELTARAAAGDLRKESVLAAEVRRMLKDERASRLATEFGGNWLDFRRFDEHNAVDRERFPVFSNELREAMFEEPIRFISDVIRNDRSVLDMLYANYTFAIPFGRNKRCSREGRRREWCGGTARAYRRGDAANGRLPDQTHQACAPAREARILVARRVPRIHSTTAAPVPELPKTSTLACRTGRAGKPVTCACGLSSRFDSLD